MSTSRWFTSRWGILVVGLVGLAIASGGGVLWLRERTRRLELAEARQAFGASLFSLAHQRLARLAESRPDDGEVLLLLGECDLARGHREEALEAWAKVPQWSAHFARAAVLLATHLVNAGRYSPAEEVLLRAVATVPATESQELERTLSRLYRFEGRFEDVRRLLRRSWCRSQDPAGVLREIWLLDNSPMPVESWGLALEKADQEDDRVWLGRANHALVTGRFEESARWLSRCGERRADDPSVWEANLELALAHNELPRFWKAAQRLPSIHLHEPDLFSLRAWLAERRGDRLAQQHELERLVKVRPGDTRALERLAALMLEAGQPHEAERLHRMKAQADSAKDRVRKILLDESQMLSHASELSQLMVTLSRDFDAEAWSLLTQAHSSAKESAKIHFDGSLPLPAALLASARQLSARVENDIESQRHGSTTLADRLADLLPESASTPEKVAKSSRVDELRNGLAGTRTPRFQDDAESAGLRFLFDNGQTPEHFLPETMAGGVGLIDYDGDGWLDVYCVQGGPLNTGSSLADQAIDRNDRLFRNRGDGTFEDVTAETGLESLLRGRGYGLGVAVGDYDNDGYADLFLTRLRSYVLLRNKGGRHSRMSRKRRGLPASATTPPPPRSPISTTTATSTSTSATTWSGTPRTPALCKNDKGGLLLLRSQQGRACARPCFPQLTGPIHRRHGTGGFRRSGRPEPGRGRRRRQRRRLIDLFVSNDGTANYLFHQSRPIPLRGIRADLRRRGRTPGAATRPGWASPAATSTATACPS